jgi:hypothetical protein
MTSVLFIRPYIGNANGLCNQLSFLINGILYASKNGIKIVKVAINYSIDTIEVLPTLKNHNIENEFESNYIDKLNIASYMDEDDVKNQLLILSGKMRKDQFMDELSQLLKKINCESEENIIETV